MDLRGYTNIPDWMLTLDLDVYETIILAVIYGFSQDGESTFSGSQMYLARKARCSKRKVANALVNLVARKLVKKIDVDVRGIHLCEYKVCIGIAPDATGGDAPGATNNIELENIDNSISNKAKAFEKPSLQEVTEYCNQRGNDVNPQAFIDHYESNGWMVGKTHMKDWKAAVRTWEHGQARRPAQAQRKESVLEHNLKVYDNMFGTDLHSQAYGKKEVCDEQ